MIILAYVGINCRQYKPNIIKKNHNTHVQKNDCFSNCIQPVIMSNDERAPDKNQEVCTNYIIYLKGHAYHVMRK